MESKLIEFTNICESSDFICCSIESFNIYVVKNSRFHACLFNGEHNNEIF